MSQDAIGICPKCGGTLKKVTPIRLECEDCEAVYNIKYFNVDIEEDKLGTPIKVYPKGSLVPDTNHTSAYKCTTACAHRELNSLDTSMYCIKCERNPHYFLEDNFKQR